MAQNLGNYEDVMSAINPSQPALAATMKPAEKTNAASASAASSSAPASHCSCTTRGNGSSVLQFLDIILYPLYAVPFPPFDQKQ